MEPKGYSQLTDHSRELEVDMTNDNEVCRKDEKNKGNSLPLSESLKWLNLHFSRNYCVDSTYL